MARWVPAGVDVNRLSTWLDSGFQMLDPYGTCVFIAPKRSREKDCRRHGGEFPALVRSAEGQCPVRVGLYTPDEMVLGSTVRAIVVLRGTRSHVFPVCKPSSAVVHDVLDKLPSLPIRTLQVRSLGILGGVESIICRPARGTVLFNAFIVGFLTLQRTLGHPDVFSLIDRGPNP